MVMQDSLRPIAKRKKKQYSRVRSIICWQSGAEPIKAILCMSHYQLAPLRPKQCPSERYSSQSCIVYVTLAICAPDRSSLFSLALCVKPLNITATLSMTNVCHRLRHVNFLPCVNNADPARSDQLWCWLTNKIMIELITSRVRVTSKTCTARW